MNPQDWIGRQETAEDEVSVRLIDGFNAAFDRIGEPAEIGGPAPLGLHWCLAPTMALQSALGPDGHPARGGFSPPIALPRRMWAGGELRFHDNLRAGDKVTRQSRIASVTAKQGRSGPLCFVSVDHQVFSPRGLAIEERQDIVYREAQSTPAEPPAPGREPSVPAKWQQKYHTDPVMLFRYSALSFNGHRIHYDRDYATKMEHYRGLVVHGPLQATLLLGFAAECAKASPTRFNFRGMSPLIDLDHFSLNARPVENDLELWIEINGASRTMQALAAFS